MPIGPLAHRHPPTLVDIPVSRKLPIRRDTYPATTASTISPCSVAVNRGRPTDSPAIDTWLDRHPRTTADCLVPRHRITLSPLLNVCWRRRPPRRPPPRKPVNILRFRYLSYFSRKYKRLRPRFSLALNEFQHFRDALMLGLLSMHEH